MSLATLPETGAAAPSDAIDAPSAASTRSASARGGAAVFAVLFLATLLNGLDASEFTSASPVIARELHVGINAIGVLASAFTVFLTVSIIPIGLWADCAPRSRIIAACLAMWRLATALTGVGEAGYMPVSGALVRQTFAPERRAPVMSWLLGDVAGPILGIVLGGVVAGAAPGAWRLRTPRVSATDGAFETTPAAFRPRAVAADLAALLRNPALLGLLASAC